MSTNKPILFYSKKCVNSLENFTSILWTYMVLSEKANGSFNKLDAAIKLRTS